MHELLTWFTAQPIWINLPIAWLVSGLTGKAFIELANAIVKKQGRGDYWTPKIKPLERHLYVPLGGPITFLVGFFAIFSEIRHVRCLFRKSVPKEEKSKK